MTLFLQLVAAFQAAAEIANHPDTLALLAKIREWVASLPLWQQAAFASQFEPFKGYGCANCDDADMPVVPEDCRDLVAKLIEASKAGQ
jgi:hypothetical protein